MVAALGKIWHSLRRTHSDAQLPNVTLAEFFTIYLSQYMNKSIDVRTCIDQCCQRIWDEDNNAHFSRSSQPAHIAILQNFEKAVSSLSFAEKEKNLLIGKFKHNFGQETKQKWLDSLVETLYLIDSVDEKNKERKVWALQFLDLMDHFAIWEDNNTIRDPDYIREYIQQLATKFVKFCGEKAAEAEETLVRSAQKTSHFSSEKKMETEINLKRKNVKEEIDLAIKSIWQTINENHKELGKFPTE